MNDESDINVLKEQILSHFKKFPDRRHSLTQLFKATELPTKEGRELLFQALNSLEKQEKIIQIQQKYKYLPPSNFWVGVIDFVHPRYAFLLNPEGEDLRIRKENLKGAMHGDRVRAKELAHRKNQDKQDKVEAVVVEIQERNTIDLVGNITSHSAKLSFASITKKIHYSIQIKNIDNQRTNTKVVAKIKKYPSHSEDYIEAEITQVLGEIGENEAEIHAIMVEFKLQSEFPEEVERFAKNIPEKITETEIKKRKDFRKITTFTIDPLTAKDFDDALSVEFLSENKFRIGVHIADVTHYVPIDSILEKEAYRRATSVYLVDRTVPMLPENLSNGLCSLVPHQDRLTYSVVFEMDVEGKISDFWIGRTVIHSDRRFAYEEAQKVLNDKKGDFFKELELLDLIAKKLRKKRFESGAMNFETQEVQFKLDEQKKPVGVYVKERVETHLLIEEFMLLANQTVATWVRNLDKKTPKTMIYRVHEPPNEEKLENFARFVSVLGYKLKTGKNINHSMNELIESLNGKPEQSFLQTLAIRTMSKARYSTEPLGHFGLAMPFYSHFTSPIRRYPDMIAHRLITKYIEKEKSQDAQAIEIQCKHSSERERLATDAERASIKYKQIQYLLSLDKGHAFEGVISGVAEFGIFVEIIEAHCEGLIRMTDLSRDFYEYDKQNYRLVGRRTNHTLAFGDVIKVRVKQANLSTRELDLVMDGDTPSIRKPQNRSFSKKKRK